MCPKTLKYSRLFLPSGSFSFARLESYVFVDFEGVFMGLVLLVEGSSSFLDMSSTSCAIQRNPSYLCSQLIFIPK